MGHGGRKTMLGLCWRGRCDSLTLSLPFKVVQMDRVLGLVSDQGQ